jgi:hypothetical protein
MTKLQVAVAGLVAIASITTPWVVQQRSLNGARQENVALRQQTGQLTALLDETQRALDAESEQLQRLRGEQVELLQLRNEVGQLRQQFALMKVPRPVAVQNQPVAQVETNADPNATKETMRQLGLAASRGDFSALDKLAEHAAAAIKARTNVQQYVPATLMTRSMCWDRKPARGTTPPSRRFGAPHATKVWMDWPSALLGRPPPWDTSNPWQSYWSPKGICFCVRQP